MGIQDSLRRLGILESHRAEYNLYLQGLHDLHRLRLVPPRLGPYVHQGHLWLCPFQFRIDYFPDLSACFPSCINARSAQALPLPQTRLAPPMGKDLVALHSWLLMYHHNHYGPF